MSKCTTDIFFFNCMIIDNEAMAIRTLERQIEKIPELRITQSFTDPFQGLSALQRRPMPHILFLDVEMDRLNGIELLRQLPHQSLAVILCTAYREFAADGFDLEVTDFLVKPFAFDRLLKAVRKAQARHRNSVVPDHPVLRDYIHVYVNKAYRLLYISEINYIHSDNSGVYISLNENDERIRVYEALETLIERLPAPRFIRLHRQCVVQTNRIRIYEKGYITLSIPEHKRLSVSEEGKERLSVLLGLDSGSHTL